MRFAATTLGRLAILASLTSSAAADVIVVQQVGNTFVPQDIQICVGDTVRWVWNSGFHTVTQGTDGTVDGNEFFHSPLDSSNTVYAVTFDAAFLAANPIAANVYDYFCTFHFSFANMVGSVTVDPGPIIYCTGKASSVGCIAAIGTSNPNCNPVSGAGGYGVTATNVHSFKTGLVFAGVSGPSATPFSGGILCVTPPTKRGPLINSLGTGPDDCSGTYNQIVNDGLIIPLGLDVGPGNSGWYQFWYRDPANGAGTLGTALSNGLELDFL